MHPFFRLQQEIANMPGSCSFAAHFPSAASAVRNLNSLSFVQISAAGVANLPAGVRCGIAPMQDNSAAVILGGILTAEQRAEAFSLLDRVAHDGLVVVMPPDSQPLRTRTAEKRELVGSGLVGKFVTDRNLRWNHQEWLEFLSSVRNAGFTGLSDDEIGQLLEEEKAERLKNKTDREK